MIDVLANDIHPDGDALRILDISPPSQGVAEIVDGRITFRPGADFDHLAPGETTVERFVYRVTDNFGGIAEGAVTVTVTGLRESDEDDGVVVIDDGDGQTVIDEDSPYTTIVLPGGLTLADLRFQRSGHPTEPFAGTDLTLPLGEANALVIRDFFTWVYERTNFWRTGLSLRFADGTEIDLAAHPLTLVGDETGAALFGTDFADTLVGLAGDDLLKGGDEADVYVFDPGFGHDTVEDPDALNTFRFGEGIAFEDITFRRGGGETDPFAGENLILDFASGDSLTLTDFFTWSHEDTGYWNTHGVLVFADGTEIDLAAHPLTLVGDETGAALFGTDFADTLVGLAGDDLLKGGDEADVYVFDPGFGHDTVEDPDALNTFRFGEGISLDRLTASRIDEYDLLVETGTGDSVRFSEFFSWHAPDHEIWNAYGVMTFANGEVAPVTSLIEDWEV